MTDFQNSFTVILSRKFAIKILLQFPPHLSWVSCFLWTTVYKYSIPWLDETITFSKSWSQGQGRYKVKYSSELLPKVSTSTPGRSVSNYTVLSLSSRLANVCCCPIKNNYAHLTLLYTQWRPWIIQSDRHSEHLQMASISHKNALMAPADTFWADARLYTLWEAKLRCPLDICIMHRESIRPTPNSCPCLRQILTNLFLFFFH